MEKSIAPPPSDTAKSKPDLAKKIAVAIHRNAPGLAEPYIAYGATEILVKECARVADYTISKEQRTVSDEEGTVQVGDGTGWWYEKMGLKPCFNTWAQVTFLHMWLLTVHIRKFPEKNAPIWHQQLVDHFFYLAEEKMAVMHNIASRSIRNSYLKELFDQWRGLSAAYDQGLVEGDAVLAAAIWRNICGAEEDVNLVRLAEATSYVRSVLQGLEELGSENIARGAVIFEDPSDEKHLVSLKSRLWAQETEAAMDKTIASSDPNIDPKVLEPKAKSVESVQEVLKTNSPESVKPAATIARAIRSDSIPADVSGDEMRTTATPKRPTYKRAPQTKPAKSV